MRENRRFEPGCFWGKCLCLTTVVIFYPTRPTRSGERGRFVRLFQRCRGLWTSGFWLARRLHQLKASTTMDLCCFFSSYFCTMCGLEKLELVDQNWLERIFSCVYRERWSCVGDNIPSRSSLLSIWSKEV